MQVAGNLNFPGIMITKKNHSYKDDSKLCTDRVSQKCLFKLNSKGYLTGNDAIVPKNVLQVTDVCKNNSKTKLTHTFCFVE